MTYVVTEACIRCKYMDCVTVCPVDCFHEGDVMLSIDPEKCIDCGVCVPECPVGAIVPDTTEGSEVWVNLNKNCSKKWPGITKKGIAPSDADEWANVKDKLQFLDEEILKNSGLKNSTKIIKTQGD